MHNSLIIQYFLLYLLVELTYAFESTQNFTRFPPCKACKTFVDSFKKGLDRTSKYKFEGGDTAWEEEKLGEYATSEVRFVEIHEKLCSELKVGREQCYELLEKYDDTLEDWWFQYQKKEPNLLKHLCIDRFPVCCPELHFGKDCTPCSGYPDTICNNNGKCKGSGTRKGDGKCHCDQGYTGDYCDQCATNYYESYRDEKKFLCSECHISCDGQCLKAGPQGCSKCKSGWIMNKEGECLDINECAESKSHCTPLQFCVNNEGGFKCLDCDRSCAGCTEDGPDMCKNCASGYIKKDNMCVDSTEESRKNFVSFSRHLTYLGLCIATCIILKKNVYLAAVIGLCVAIYISIAEYMLNTPPAIDKNDLEKQVAEEVMKAFN